MKGIKVPGLRKLLENLFNGRGFQNVVAIFIVGIYSAVMMVLTLGIAIGFQWVYAVLWNDVVGMFTNGSFEMTWWKSIKMFWFLTISLMFIFGSYGIASRILNYADKKSRKSNG